MTPKDAINSIEYNEYIDANDPIDPINSIDFNEYTDTNDPIEPNEKFTRLNSRPP